MEELHKKVRNININVIQMKSTGIISRLTSVNCDYTQPRMPSSSPLYTNIQFKTQNCDSVVLCGCDVIKGKS